MTESVDCVVIGAGVVGLAVARELATSGRDVVVLERNAGIGEETSSRNSEVIHAGIHYPPGTLKATLCVLGKQLLYDYCARRRVPFRRCGKLTVATDESQCDRLDDLIAQAFGNGVDDLVRLDAAELRRRAPMLAGAGAFWSPSSGIVDSHALMLALRADLEAADGVVALNTPVETLQVDDTAIVIGLADETMALRARTVVNAAGLGALRLAKAVSGTTGEDLPVGHLAKGNYFSYRGKSPFQMLVYPLPAEGGLGIHATIDLEANLRFGPDLEWVDDVDYTVSSDRLTAFVEAIRTYWPSVEPARLSPAYAGVRPKLSGPGEPVADFRIDVAAASRQRQLVHLLGIESPGLTASLAIAGAVRRHVERA